MGSRRGHAAAAAAILFLALPCGVALGDDGPTTTTAVTDTTTTTAETTTAETTTATVAPPPTTTAPSFPPLASATRSFTSGCPMAAVALLLPNRAPRLLGPVLTAPAHTASLSELGYPGDGSVVAASSVELAESACTARGAGGSVSFGPLSLFGGAVQALGVHWKVGAAPVVTGLGSAPSWATVDVGAHLGAATAALSVRLKQARAGLPAGSVLLIGAAADRPPAPAGPKPNPLVRPKPKPVVVPAKHSQRKRQKLQKHPRRHRRKAAHEPLRATPKLGVKRLVFPVAGRADYYDTYGGPRSDVPGGWHHGDDIFAALGTPIVAVADGTLNRVGWNRVGGWRLWVRDKFGDQFYYAHLSGYVRSDLQSKRVRAGQVIGFVGNTGDAFRTPPHLHFEVHPRRLLHLGYDGAVDPTTYLNGWTRVEHVAVPLPVQPRVPSWAPRAQAHFVFRELLAARHLLPKTPAKHPTVPRATDAGTVAEPTLAATTDGAGFPVWAIAALAIGGVALIGAAAARRKRT